MTNRYEHEDSRLINGPLPCPFNLNANHDCSPGCPNYSKVAANFEAFLESSKKAGNPITLDDAIQMQKESGFIHNGLHSIRRIEMEKDDNGDVAYNPKCKSHPRIPVLLIRFPL